MNRNQYWVLLAGSCLVVLFLVLQIISAHSAQYAQARVMAAQQVITEGRSCDARMRQLAARVYQVSQQTQDQGLKDLLVRQQISFTPPTGTAGAPAQPAAAPIQPAR